MYKLVMSVIVSTIFLISGQVVFAETNQVDSNNFSIKAQNENGDINSWMPNKDFQKDVLENLIRIGELNTGDSVNDITKENVKKSLHLKI